MTDGQKIQRITGCIRDSRYLDTDRTARISRLTDMMYDAYSRKGQNAGNAETLAETLDREISEYMGYQLSFSEACLAIDWGLHGEYGEYTGLNTERLFRFVRSYLESEVRQQALTRMRLDRPGPSPRSADEVHRLNWESMLGYARDRLDEWRSTGQLECLGTQSPGGVLPEGVRLCSLVCCMYTVQWLKRVGILGYDGDTLATENGLKRRAMGILHTGEESFAVRALAGALMLRETFMNADAAGVDLAEELDRVSDEIPEAERRFWT